MSLNINLVKSTYPNSNRNPRLRKPWCYPLHYRCDGGIQNRTGSFPSSAEEANPLPYTSKSDLPESNWYSVVYSHRRYHYTKAWSMWRDLNPREWVKGPLSVPGSSTHAKLIAGFEPATIRVKSANWNTWTLWAWSLRVMLPSWKIASLSCD